MMRKDTKKVHVKMPNTSKFKIQGDTIGSVNKNKNVFL